MNEVDVMGHEVDLKEVSMQSMSGTGAVGRSAQKRQRAITELVRRMQHETRPTSDGKIEGPLRPCTIVNFNPLELVVQGQLRLTVPKPGTNDRHRVRVDYRGRQILGHYCYVASPMVGHPKPDQEPIYYTTTVGHERDQLLPIDVPTCEARVFTPISIACELWSQYNSPTHKMMGGVLIFDQGPRALSRDSLARTGGRILVPERTQLADSVQYSYSFRETTVDDELERIFQRQHEYCDLILQQAHNFFVDDDPQSRRMITDTHRDWARFAHSIGHLAKLPEWVSARLSLGEGVRDLVTCAYCGKQQANPNIYFCPGCHAPYDAYAAYMAGLVVPDAYLEALEGEQLKQVMMEREKRRARFSGTKKAKNSPASPAADEGATQTDTGGQSTGE